MAPYYLMDRPWTPADDAQLINMARQHLATWWIALTLGRTESAVRARAAFLGISLFPKDPPRY